MRFISNLLLAASMWLLAAVSHAAGLQVGDAPAVPVVRAIDGKTIDVAALRGKVVVISYFASNCPFCMNEAPKLQKLYRENKDKLVVIGVNIEKNNPEQRTRTEQWIAKYKLSYPVTTDFAAFENALGRLKGLPVNQIFDRNGKVARIDVGEIFDEDFDDIARMAR